MPRLLFVDAIQRQLRRYGAPRISIQTGPPVCVRQSSCVAARLAAIALDHGLALYWHRTNSGNYGNWVMVSPRLIFTAAEIDEIVDLLEQLLAAYETELRESRYSVRSDSPT